MAKRKTTAGKTQAEAIREGWQALGKTARGVDVIAYVDEHYPAFGLGDKASAGALVSQTKAKVFGRRRKKPKKKVKRSRPASRRPRRRVRADSAADVGLLLQARDFVGKCGSVDRAIAVLKQLRQLQM